MTDKQQKPVGYDRLSGSYIFPSDIIIVQDRVAQGINDEQE